MHDPRSLPGFPLRSCGARLVDGEVGGSAPAPLSEGLSLGAQLPSRVVPEQEGGGRLARRPLNSSSLPWGQEAPQDLRSPEQAPPSEEDSAEAERLKTEGETGPSAPPPDTAPTWTAGWRAGPRWCRAVLRGCTRHMASGDRAAKHRCSRPVGMWAGLAVEGILTATRGRVVGTWPSRSPPRCGPRRNAGVCPQQPKDRTAQMSINW